MRSWVRYSVAVYIGLMIAGALAGHVPQSTDAMPLPFYDAQQGQLPPYPHEKYPQTWHRRTSDLKEETQLRAAPAKRRRSYEQW